VKLGRQLRRNWLQLVAVLAIVGCSLPVGAYILAHQRLPFPWEDTYRVSAQFSSAQAVTPGQGQNVTVAGVTVGEISNVTLQDGRALVEMQIKRDQLPAVYSNAKLLLRPKTGLNDMSVQMDPGDPPGHKLADGATLPIANTQPAVNPDEVLASLDADTRPYLSTLLNEGGRALDGRAIDLRRILKAAEPTLQQTERVTRAIAGRRVQLRRLIHNLGALSQATANKDVQLARLVDSADATFSTIAGRESELRASLAQLPGVLEATRGALSSGQRATNELGPTLRSLRPAARELPDTLVQIRPLLRQGTPIVRKQLRPFVHEAAPMVADLRPALRDLGADTPDLVTAFDVLNYVVNELAYNPSGSSEEGYLFWASWFFHNSASLLSIEDTHGAVWRGQLIASCSAISGITAIAPLMAAQLPLPVCPADASKKPGGH
jgi:phospholipid/cholesterol/gamma-HCH transport system substrate-binding protein